MLSIKFETEGFPTGSPISNGNDILHFEWDDLLWSALTIGRPNVNCVFQHGESSYFGAVFRLSLIRMSLFQADPSTNLRRTDAAKSLDPSEKGAVSYFLGMVCCKLFADKCLNTPWLLHLDVFGRQLSAVLRGRSRPDLIGQSRDGNWIAFESKGRILEPNAVEKQKAKDQATRCLSVNGLAVSCHIGASCFFKNDALRFFWADPTPPKNPKGNDPLSRIDCDENVWRHHYASILALSDSDSRTGTEQEELRPDGLVSGPDVTVEIFPNVRRLLISERWGQARDWCIKNAAKLVAEDFRPDGTRVYPGSTWGNRDKKLFR